MQAIYIILFDFKTFETNQNAKSLLTIGCEDFYTQAEKKSLQILEFCVDDKRIRKTTPTFKNCGFVAFHSIEYFQLGKRAHFAIQKLHFDTAQFFCLYHGSRTMFGERF